MSDYTLAILQQQVLAELNEESDSTAAELDSSSGITVETTQQAITRYLSQGVGFLARSCMAWKVNNVNIVIPPGNNIIDFNSVTATASDGSTIWYPTILSINGTYIGPPTDRSYIDMNPYMNPNYLATATNFIPGVQWTKEGNIPQIAIYPPIASTSTLTVEGYGIPPMPSATATSSVITWIAEDQALYLTTYAAQRVAIRNSPDDDRLTGKVAALTSLFNKIQTELSESLQQQLPYAYRAAFARNIQPLTGVNPVPISQTNPNA